jgi:Zn-dependent protease with chaperone function
LHAPARAPVEADEVDRHQFRALIHRLEPFAARHPQRYRLQVLALAALGYAYLAAVLAAMTGVIVGLASFVMSMRGGVAPSALLWALASAAVLLMRAVWVRVPSPEGLTLEPAQGRSLFAWLERLRREGRAPRIHRVLVTAELNASIVQVPRLGPFGWHRNDLTIGLPLMQALTAEELESVIAHECGHLVGNHGHTAAWIYRLRTTWTRLLARHSERLQLGTLLLVPFFRWYAPFFSAYSFVLARANELGADQNAVAAVGPETAGRALLRVALASRLLDERFWPALTRGCATMPEAPADAITRLGLAVAAPIDGETRARWLSDALCARTDYDDTHPSLRDRLRAMGWDEGAVPVMPASGESAADWFLGPLAVDVARQLDAAWFRAERQGWRERYAAARHARQELDGLADAAEHSPEAAWTRVQLMVQLEGTDAAVPYARRLLERWTDHPHATCFLGCVRLDERDPSGVQLIEDAIRRDRSLAVLGYDVLFNYFWQQGQTTLAERYRAFRDERLERLAEAEHERKAVTASTRCRPHGLPAAALRAIRSALDQCGNVSEAYLVRREVEACPEWPCYVLAVSPGAARRGADDYREVLRRASQSTEWPEGTYVFHWAELPKRLRSTIADVPSARVF